jgi:hypothetical protein
MAKKKRIRKPELVLCATAWTLTGYPSQKNEWSFARKIKEAKKAGFEGFSAGAIPEVIDACREHVMEFVGGIDIASVAEADGKLRAFKEGGATHVNVQLCDHDTPIPQAVTVARRVMVAGREMGLKPAIEWHRDTCTETPEKGMALAAQYEKRYKEKLRVNFDHSHPAIIKQIRPADFWERLSGFGPDLLRASELIHFRTFTGSHCQTPVTNGKGKLDGDFITWRDKFLKPCLEFWLKGARAGKKLYAVVELGPKGSGYGLECFPDIWHDAIVARGEIERVWRNIQKRG